MKNIPEELIYVLIFGAILLFQYLMKRFGPQQQPDEAPQEAPLPQEKPAAQEDSLPDIWGRAPAVPAILPLAAASDIRFGRAGAPGATVTLPGRRSRRFSRSALMGNRREVQNAIVIATILGPCRAYEPHDNRR
ncbi:MAG: hypothetical protein HYS65_10285 [Betaproteobacteria bacterium]|nr:hypothetical protein [Betaproteobacteria bacterium]